MYAQKKIYLVWYLPFISVHGDLYGFHLYVKLLYNINEIQVNVYQKYFNLC